MCRGERQKEGRDLGISDIQSTRSIALTKLHVLARDRMNSHAGNQAGRRHLDIKWVWLENSTSSGGIPIDWVSDDKKTRLLLTRK